MVGESEGDGRFHRCSGGCHVAIRLYRVGWHPRIPRTCRRNRVHRNGSWYHWHEQRDSRSVPPGPCPNNRVHLNHPASGTGGAGLITDRKVLLLRQKLMEGKGQETTAAVAGMSVRQPTIDTS